MTAHKVRPPDLEMQVRIGREQEGIRLIYTLHSSTGVVPFSRHEIPGPVFKGNPEELQCRLIAKIRQLAEGQDVDGSLLNRDVIEDKLKNFGRDLWRDLMPLEIRNAYRDEIRDKVRSWWIVSDEPWIPWELLKPSERDLEDDFLVHRFELTRWLTGNQTPAQQITVRRFAAMATAPDLVHAREERKVVQAMMRSAPEIEDATPRWSTAKSFLKLLESCDIDLLHLAGHGSHDESQPDEMGITFGDCSVVRSSDLGGPLEARVARNQPLVFLNACWAGQQGWKLTGLGGWAARWVGRCGCGAFVAPLWPVRDKTAFDFASAFYEALSQGETLGFATLQARLHVASQPSSDPLALAYTVYGHPNARLSFGKDLAGRETPGNEPPPPPPKLSEQEQRPPPDKRRLGRRWLAVAAVAFLLVVLVVLARVNLRTSLQGGHGPLKSKLESNLRELGDIKADWDKRYSECESLADRVASSLDRGGFQDEANRIRERRKTAKTSKPVCDVVGEEIPKVIDQIDAVTTDKQ